MSEHATFKECRNVWLAIEPTMHDNNETDQAAICFIYGAFNTIFKPEILHYRTNYEMHRIEKWVKNLNNSGIWIDGVFSGEELNLWEKPLEFAIAVTLQALTMTGEIKCHMVL